MRSIGNASYIDAEAVARELLDGAEVCYGYHGERDRQTRRLALPDGRVATLRVVYDEDSGIGEWFGTNGERMAHHDDVFGTFAWRGTDRLYGYPSSRPTHLGFDGRSEVFRRYGQGADRIDGAVWWQPPADLLEQANVDSVLPDLRRHVESWLSGDWFHVGFVVSIVENGDETGESAIWGVEWDFPGGDEEHLVAVVTDCLEDAGIGKASSAAAAPWARDLLEALARRVSGADPDDSGADAERYFDTLRNVMAWWHDHIEPRGDWDTYADGLVTRMESDFLTRKN